MPNYVKQKEVGQGCPAARLQHPQKLDIADFRSRFEDKTKCHLNKLTKMANKYQQLAYQVARGFWDHAA